MKNNKLNKNTKKLQDLVKARKTSVVVYKQGTLKRTSAIAGDKSYGTEGYSYYEDE